MTNINQTHNGTGDNVAGDKISGKEKENPSIPVWALWTGWAIGILTFAWGFYIYIFPHYQK